jgi:hypothetical protein
MKTTATLLLAILGFSAQSSLASVADLYVWNDAPSEFLTANATDYVVEFHFLTSNGSGSFNPNRGDLKGFKVLYRTSSEKKFILEIVNSPDKIKKLQAFAMLVGKAAYNTPHHFVAVPLLESGDMFPEVCDGTATLFSAWAKDRTPNLGLFPSPGRADKSPWYCGWTANPVSVKQGSRVIWKNPSR